MSDGIRPLTRYRSRIVEDEIDELLDALPAISLEGARGVGKTETARRRARTRFELDRPDQLQVVEADPERLTAGPEPILIDEWQLFPSSWDLVRRAVDEDPRPGRFLLTGSASPDAPETHTGAGRIVTVRMRPFTLAERGVDRPTVSLGKLLGGSRPAASGRTSVRLERYVDEILVGGFPGMRRPPGPAQRALLNGYLDRIIDRDFPSLGHRIRNPAALRRWLRAYAAATATSASYETIRDAATGGEGDKPAKTTTIPYRDTLERLWISDPVPAWSPTRSYLAHLGQAPKHHLVDPALVARLLGVSREALLSGEDGAPPMPRDGTLLGALFESLVTLDLRVYAQRAEGRVRHLRTWGGEHEVDLIVVRDDQRVLAVEVKLSVSVRDDDVKHLHWLREKLDHDLVDAMVVTTGEEAYRRSDGIAVVPAALLGP